MRRIQYGEYCPSSNGPVEIQLPIAVNTDKSIVLISTKGNRDSKYTSCRFAGFTSSSSFKLDYLFVSDAYENYFPFISYQVVEFN